MKELAWIEEARKHIGLQEIKGHGTNPKITAMLDKMGDFNNEGRPWWRDDETPWCGLFVGYCLGMADRYVVPEWYRAKSWNSPNMTSLTDPAYGCVVVFDRAGGGHVGFIVGADKSNNLMVLGGNQSNRVSIVPFSRNRNPVFLWASRVSKSGDALLSNPLDERYRLPVLDSNGKVSTNEA